MKKLSFKEKLGFCSFIGGEKLLYVIVTTYATLFYITKLELSPLFVAGLVFATRMFDAVNDPIIGSLIEKGKTKLKVYINLTAILLPLTTLLIFICPPFSGIALYGYVTITYIIWSVFYTISEVPIYSIVSHMTADKDEQNYVLSISQVGSMVGIFFGMFLIAYYLRNGVDSISWIPFATSFAILALIQMLMTVFFVHEKVEVTETSSDLPLLSVLKQTFADRNLLTIMVIYMSQLFLNAASVIGAYVFDGYYHHPSMGSLVGIIGILVIIPIAFSMSKLVRNFGKTNIIYFAAGCMIVPNLAVIIFDLHGVSLIIGLLVSQLGVVLPSILRPLYTRECIDYTLQTKGVSNEASAFSLMTFFNKAGDALGASLGSLLLVVVGFDQTAAISSQLPSTIKSLQIAYFSGALLMGLVWLFGIRYFYRLANRKQISPEVSVANTELVQ